MSMFRMRRAPRSGATATATVPSAAAIRTVRGESDTLVAYAGGNTGSTGWYSPGAKGTLELWKKIDGCTGPVQKSLQYCETYTGCMAGVEVTLCSLPGVGHILYDNPLDFDVPNTAWEMFKRQPMP